MLVFGCSLNGKTCDELDTSTPPDQGDEDLSGECLAGTCSSFNASASILWIAVFCSVLLASDIESLFNVMELEPSEAEVEFSAIEVDVGLADGKVVNSGLGLVWRRRRFQVFGPHNS